MASFCNKCQGAAEPAAQMRTFEYEGQTLRCLSLVSSCIICGHRWEDEMYDAENALFAEQARAAVSSRSSSPVSWCCRRCNSQECSMSRCDFSQWEL